MIMRCSMVITDGGSRLSDSRTCRCSFASSCCINRLSEPSVPLVAIARASRKYQDEVVASPSSANDNRSGEG